MLTVKLTLRYHPSALVPGGVSRDEPSTAAELVEEISRHFNASHPRGGGLIDLTLDVSAERDTPDYPGDNEHVR